MASSSYNASTAAAELVHDLATRIKGKIILVTGVSPGGLGAVFAEAVAEAQPAALILAGRNPARVAETVKSITALNNNISVRSLTLDLGSLVKVREAASEVNSWDDITHINVLINNAGIMATDYARSPEGFEGQFATNHLGPFLFTNLIMNKILAAKNPRIVNVSSDGHRLHPIRFFDCNFSDGELYDKWAAYGQSKTANMLMALSLAQKLGESRGLVSCSLHPGVIGTNLTSHLGSFDDLNAADKQLGNREGWADFKWKTPEQGAATHVYAAFHPDLQAHNGAYLQDCHVADPWEDTVKPWGTNVIEAERLWKLSEELVGQKFSY
ncbi:hypothetical protein QQS21_005628 [Conoideocrella luteorostrata]|uniref:Short-chain dehydrogenase n=1 Tax=Conoideocrella luteorostrata TaxID=1105319 RepID=A0AAJ0CRU2_9HYPO|nr:hypothetical protein QQS21_005628 [Conoideocrella luteorostrata]